MLPRLAATVCRTMTGISRFCCPVMDRTRTVNGTKVISATSLVISMLRKKHRNTRTAESCLVSAVRLRMKTAIFRNTPCS